MTKKSNSMRVLILSVVALAVGVLAGAGIYEMRASANSAASSASLTLDPSFFQGETRNAYLVAQKHPDLLAQLDCYCGCEQHEGHKNLLDCFRTNHGAGCATCVGEAVTAGELADGGMPVQQIRDALRQRYAHGE
jgi:uncharacterized protein with PCYCGC motif